MSNINSLLTQIENHEIVLPAIQRDFVWQEDQILTLFDSIMRGYPLGIILIWETYLDIKHRKFVKDYQPDTIPVFDHNKKGTRLKLVLDGQQRLQSLYIGVYGTLEKRELFFDLLSGRSADDFREIFYKFRFFTKDEVEQINEKSIESFKEGQSQEEPEYFYRVSDLLNNTPTERLQLRNQVKSHYQLLPDEEARIDLNIQILVHSLSNDTNILKVSTIDEGKAKDNVDRKSESDILEAFVRINRQGTLLNRSDLIFSMLKLNWKESAEELPEFVKKVNEGNNLNLDTDFVIRSLFVVSNLGSRFDVDLLRKKSNVEIIKANYERTCNAIKSLVDFLTDECKITNSSLIGGNLNLIPFVYYLAYIPKHVIPNNQIERTKKALFIFGFMKPFSRYADSRIGKFIKIALLPLVESKDSTFPLEGSIYWTKQWERYFDFNADLLALNPLLTLHLLQGKSGAAVKYKKNAPELDHIFPQSVLRDLKIDWSLINHFANFWILEKHKNQNKSNKHPKEYFADVSDSFLEKVFIDREMLDYKKFGLFLDWRKEKILEKIKETLGVKERELNYSTYWKE